MSKWVIIIEVVVSFSSWTGFKRRRDKNLFLIFSGTSSFFSKTKRKPKIWKRKTLYNSKVEAQIYIYVGVHPFIIHTRLAFYFLNAYVNKINSSVRHSSISYGSRLRVSLHKQNVLSHAIQLIKREARVLSIIHVVDKENFHVIFKKDSLIRTCEEKRTKRLKKKIMFGLCELMNVYYPLKCLFQHLSWLLNVRIYEMFVFCHFSSLCYFFCSFAPSEL